MARFKNQDWNLPTAPNSLAAADWETVSIAILMDLRDELQALNHVFACQNFQSIPRELRAIKRELATIRKAAVK